MDQRICQNGSSFQNVHHKSDLREEERKLKTEIGPLNEIPEAASPSAKVLLLLVFLRCQERDVCVILDEISQEEEEVNEGGSSD